MADSTFWKEPEDLTEIPEDEALKIAEDESLSENADEVQTPKISEVKTVKDEDDDSCDDDSACSENAWEGHAIRQLMWDDDNIFRVLLQSYGSVWPRVLPFCIFNVVWTFIIWYLKEYKAIDLTISPSGHKYMAPLMSFLLVTSLNITIDRYMSDARNLRKLYKACRDMAALLCLLTANDTSKRAKQWRQDVMYSMLLLLRVTVGVLEFRSSKKNPWLLPEMELESSEEVIKYYFKDPTKDSQGNPLQTDDAMRLNEVFEHDSEVLHMDKLKKRLAHLHDSERKILEETSRSVYVLSMNVRQQILKQRDGMWFQSRELVWEHPCNEETRLLGFVDDFLKAFSGLYQLITTPFPLPLVQMNKIFLFVWIFTLPLTLCHVKMTNVADFPLVVMAVVFILTFGFMGTEYVKSELSDPFGNDPSDFDDLGQSQLAMEDCYITIYRLDGKGWAKALRNRLVSKQKSKTPQSSPKQSRSSNKSVSFRDKSDS